MRRSSSKIVHGVQPSFDPNAKALPETTVLTQWFQESYASNNCFYGTGPRAAHNLSDLTVSHGASVGSVLDTMSVQNVTAQWPASTTGHFPFHDSSAQNELTVAYQGEGYVDNLVTEQYPTYVRPTVTVPQIKVLEAEPSEDQPGISPYSGYSPISPGGFSASMGSISESLSHGGDQGSSQKCYTLWKQVRLEAIVVTGSDKFVPQTIYKPFTEADKERYLERVSLLAPIIFMTGEPLEWGISLKDIYNGNTRRLIDKDVLVLRNCGPSVSVRINWPGYPSFKRQMSSRNWRKTKGPITKLKLAQCLAKIVVEFIKKMSNRPLEADADMSWKVGPQHIQVEDLILVSLHHVSKGSWQPQFRLRREIMY